MSGMLQMYGLRGPAHPLSGVKSAPEIFSQTCLVILKNTPVWWLEWLESAGRKDLRAVIS